MLKMLNMVNKVTEFQSVPGNPLTSLSVHLIVKVLEFYVRIHFVTTYMPRGH